MLFRTTISIPVRPYSYALHLEVLNTLTLPSLDPNVRQRSGVDQRDLQYFHASAEVRRTCSL